MLRLSSAAIFVMLTIAAAGYSRRPEAGPEPAAPADDDWMIPLGRSRVSRESGSLWDGLRPMYGTVLAGSSTDHTSPPVASIVPGERSWSDGAPLVFSDIVGSQIDPWNSPRLHPDGDKHVAKSSADGDWGALSTKVALRNHDELLDPSRRHTWETDETLKMSVAGPLFLFGQLGASSPAVEQQQHKWLGRTGVGVKLKPWLLQEVQVRGGPVLRYDDTGKLKSGQSPERSELFLEAVTKVPLPVVGSLNVEYTSFAVPAVTPADRNQINQDFKLAMPFRGSSELQLGAKYRWEETTAPTPWVDRMQVYMGLQLKR